MRPTVLERYEDFKPETDDEKRLFNRMLYLQKTYPSRDLQKVQPEELRRLYKLYAKGIKDGELLEEVYSKVLLLAQFISEASRTREQMLDTHFGFREIKWAGGAYYIAHYDFFMDWLDKLAGKRKIELTGQTDEFDQLLIDLEFSRGASFDQKMIALDNVINYIHDAGPVVESFIDIDEPHRFLDELATWKPKRRPKRRLLALLSRRPIHVRAHRRRK